MSKPHHPPGSLCWFECGTTDLAAARGFYTTLFGWSVAEHPMPGEQGGTYTMLGLGEDEVAGLYQMSGPQFEGVPSHWATYVAVADVDDTARRAGNLGGKVVVPPMDVPGVGRIAFIQDPTGAHIALFKPGEHPGAARLGMAPGAFCWSELATRDTKTAEAFYTDLFGWTARSDEGGPVPYTEFQLEGQSVAGMMEMTPAHGEAPPHWLPYVLVEDCDASAARASELGGRLLVPPMDIPEVGRFSVFMDPAGAVLAIIKLTPKHGG
jgi:predicted enzyme related to lactoylglutathione lyase